MQTSWRASPALFANGLYGGLKGVRDVEAKKSLV